MLTPTPSNPHERGKYWLQAKTKQMLADNAVVLYWGGQAWRPARHSMCAWLTIRNRKHYALAAPCCVIVARGFTSRSTTLSYGFAGHLRK
jgi:hypothetical protein